MPQKGDDFDAHIASAITDHIGNVEAVYSAPGASHPSNESVSFCAVFNNAFEEVYGGETTMPVLNFETCDVPTVARSGKVRINHPSLGVLEAIIRELQPSGRGRTTATLEIV